MEKVFGYIALAMQGVKIPASFVLDALYGAQRPDKPEMCHKYAWGSIGLMEAVEKAGFREVSHREARYHFPQRDMRIEGIK